MKVAAVGARIGIRHGAELLVAEVVGLRYVEPRDLDPLGVDGHRQDDTPTRELEARLLGAIKATGGMSGRRFEPGGLHSPSLGAEAVPLEPEDVVALVCPHESAGDGLVELGSTAERQPVRVRIDSLLGQHVAVLGGTGQGKTWLTAGVLQSLLRTHPRFRAVVFDINGEYAAAFGDEDRVKVTRLGENGASRIHYHELGRGGIEQLVLASEKTQVPALRFALNALPHCTYDATRDEVTLNGAIFRDDLRPDGAEAVFSVRNSFYPRSPRPGASWPAFAALRALASDYAAVVQGAKYGNVFYERNGFLRGHVAPMLRRMQERCEDPGLLRVVDFGGATIAPSVASHAASSASPLDLFERGRMALVQRLFGSVARNAPDDDQWNVHIVDLSRCPQDVLPVVLGAIIRALSDRLFDAGPGESHPLMLVLEEAHHYIRRAASRDDGADEVLPYERLAKEGRKFGLSLWVSTQRPAELSATVLAQCGTWLCLRLTSQADTDRIRAAAEAADRAVLEKIPILPQREAVGFGAAFLTPTHFRVRNLARGPNSHTSLFHAAWSPDASEPQLELDGGDEAERIATSPAASRPGGTALTERPRLADRPVLRPRAPRGAGRPPSPPTPAAESDDEDIPF